jgi:hypothetical protein
MVYAGNDSFAMSKDVRAMSLCDLMQEFMNRA